LTKTKPAQENLYVAGAATAGANSPAKSSRLPIVIGGIVAVAAIAAAALLALRDPQTAQLPADEAAQPVVVALVEKKTEEAPQAPAAPAPKSDGIDPSSLATEQEAKAQATGGGQVAAAGAVVPGAGSAAVREADNAQAAAASPAKKESDVAAQKTATKSAAAPRDPNDLSGAMAVAVGAPGAANDDAPKATTKAIDQGSIPETPSQGAIQGAVGAVRETARACVAGQDEPSRAAITFSSSGAVSSISVSGGAEGTPSAACIRNAYKNINVGPFKRNSFSFTATIRP
jgi:hypothetical protein